MAVQKKEQHSYIDRVPLFLLLALIFLCIAIGRLFYLQIIAGDSYKAKAASQYKPSVTPIFNRGTIFMQEKTGEHIPLASLEELYTIAIAPNRIQDIEKTYTALTEAGVSLSRDRFFERAQKIDDPYEEVARDVPKKIIDTLRPQQLRGVTYVKNFKRTYPQGSIASQVVGFVGTASDGVTLRGQYGVERMHNDVLEQTKKESINIFADAFSEIGNALDNNVKKEDADVVLTIEPNVQRMLHSTLTTIRSKWGSKQIGGIVMDPRTGAILAMDSAPSFDPNQFSQYRQSSYVNPLVESVYEMGSIIKPLTIAAGLDAGVISENSTYDDKGTIVLSGYRVSNFDKKARGITDMQTVLSKSLNLGVYFIQQKLGRERFAEYFLEKYGLSERTGIDLPNEVRSITRNLQSKEEVNYATASFGQGIALTPIATIRALAALGNGGVLVSPYITEKIMYKDGSETILSKKDTTQQVISKEASEAITRLLVNTVDSALLGGSKKMKEYTVAAKTGTAEIPNSSGGYRDDAFLHSFFAYFPAYEPRFIVLLYHTEPQGNAFAADTLATGMFQLAEYLLTYYNVPPDRK